MNHLKELTEKIYNLLPELKVSDKHYKSIGLAEVLRCLLKCPILHVLAIDEEGEFIHLENGYFSTSDIYYDLKTPLLKDQSEEVINFLNERI